MDFSPSSEARQETTRYAGGDKKQNKRLTQPAATELFRPIAERKSELYGKPNEQFGAYQGGTSITAKAALVVTILLLACVAPDRPLARQGPYIRLYHPTD